MKHELETIADFIATTKPSDHIEEMNENLFLAVGFSQRVGTMMNDAEYNYSVNREQHLIRLKDMDDETETTRHAKLDSWCAGDKKT